MRQVLQRGSAVELLIDGVRIVVFEASAEKDQTMNTKAQPCWLRMSFRASSTFSD